MDPDFSSAIRDLFDGQDYTKEPAESEESPIQLRVRRTVKVGLTNALRNDPMMRGRILGNSNNKKFNADTQTSEAIIPRSVAEKNRL